MLLVRRRDVVQDDVGSVLTDETFEVDASAPQVVHVSRDDDETDLFEGHPQELDQVVIGIENGHNGGNMRHEATSRRGIARRVPRVRC